MKISFNHRLRSRFLAILMISLFISTSIIGYFLYQHFHTFLYNRFSSDLQKYIELTEHSLDFEKIKNPEREYLKNIVDEVAQLYGCRVTIIDSEGLVISDSEVPNDQLSVLENHLQRSEVQQAINENFGSDIRKSLTVGQNLLYMAKKLTHNSENIGYLRMSLKTDDVDKLLDITRNYFLIAGILVLFISSLLVIIFSTKINHNLYEIINKARRIAKGDLKTRIEINSKDELRFLGENLNEMAEKLSHSLSRLELDKNNLNTVLSSIQDGIIAINPNKEVIFFNNQALLLLDCVDSEIIGNAFYDVIRNQHLNSLLTNFFVKPIFLRDDVEFEKRTLNVIITSFDIEDAQGAVIVLRDITHYNMLEKIRKEFVANVSHEFKTPLAAIRGYGESLLDWGLKDKSKREKYVKKIVKQSNQLENLVSDLLELARLEKIQNLEFTDFYPVPVIKEILNEISDAAETKKIEIKTSFKSEDIKLVGDSEMFRSIIINLIDNAIKYTPAGGEVKVEVDVVKNNAVFSVIDTGIGIPLKNQARIFERFYRVDKGRSRSIGGTGLGLSIVKHLAELQNAEVKLSSEENKGSSFSIWFDLV